jgi:hypothetical protein
MCKRKRTIGGRKVEIVGLGAAGEEVLQFFLRVVASLDTNSGFTSALHTFAYWEKVSL